MDFRFSKQVGSGILALAFILVLLATAINPASTRDERRIEVLEKRVDELQVRVKALEDDKLPTKQDRVPEARPNRNEGRYFEVKVSNKQFQASDWKRGVYEDAVFWDTELLAVKLSKPARAIKGVLVFADLFGEVKLRVKWTVNEPIEPNGKVVKSGSGMEYNQFKDDHQWLRSTSLNDMKIWFETSQIIYRDGSTEDVSE